MVIGDREFRKWLRELEINCPKCQRVGKITDFDDKTEIRFCEQCRVTWERKLVNVQQ